MGGGILLIQLHDSCMAGTSSSSRSSVFGRSNINVLSEMCTGRNADSHGLLWYSACITIGRGNQRVLIKTAHLLLMLAVTVLWQWY